MKNNFMIFATVVSFIIGFGSHAVVKKFSVLEARIEKLESKLDKMTAYNEGMFESLWDSIDVNKEMMIDE